MEVNFYLWIFKVITALCLTKEVTGKGRIAVQLVSYNNSRGLDINGTCCDGVNITGCPTRKCDHVFDICVREPPGTNSSTNCMYGTAEINADEDQNVIQFGEGKSLFDFDIWEGGIEIFITVTDTDSGNVNVPVDNFTFDHYTSAVDYNSTSRPYDQLAITGSRRLFKTSLTMKFKAYCDPHYYGSDCSINCVADNSCKGHYNCDSKGNKVCLSGWEGDNCDIQIPGGAADCSVYQDRTEFVPSFWKGSYECPNNTQSKQFTLNVTRTQGNIKVDGQLEIDSVIIPVSGSYGSLSKTLTLQTTLNASIAIVSRNVTVVEINVDQKNGTFMDGRLRFNGNGGVICNIPVLNRNAAYFSGCNFKGTCIRYGQLKNQFYCCCNRGTVGQFCNGPISSPLTTATPVKTTPHLTTSSVAIPTSTTTRQTTQSSSKRIVHSSSTSAVSSTPTIPSTLSTLSSTFPSSLPKSTTSSTVAAVSSTTQTTTTTRSTQSTTQQRTTATPKTTSHTTSTTSTIQPTTVSTTPTPVSSTKSILVTAQQTLTSTSSSSKTAMTTQSSSTISTSTKMPITTQSKTSTGSPRTSAASTAEPTTTTIMKASTAEPTTTTIMKTSTTEPTTTIMKTSTTEPTTTTSISVAASTTSATTVTSTTRPTTVKATTTITTTPLPSTSPTTVHLATTEPQKPFDPNVAYKIIVQLVEEELESDKIQQAISNAWIKATKEGQDGANLNLTSLEINNLSWYDALGDDGVFVTVLEYKIAIHGHVEGKIYKPSFVRMENEINAKYRGDIKLYRGKLIYLLKNSFQVYIYGPAPTESLTNKLKMTFRKLLMLKSNSSNSDILTNSSISLKRTEQYIGDQGVEITKLYLYVEKNDTIIDRMLLPTVTDIDVQTSFRNNSLNVRVYTGSQKLRYRFHYDLFVRGYVFPVDFAKFEVEIQKVWCQTYGELICRLCNVSILRTEEYIGSGGETLTSIIYFFRLRQTVTKPVSFPEPSTQLFNNSMNISNLNGQRYELYMGLQHYRYLHRYSLLIKDKVDSRDNITIVTNIEAAWNNISFAGKVNILLKAQRQFLSKSGETVTELVCFISRGSVFIDVRILDVPTDVISQWLYNHSRVVSRRSGQKYVMYTGQSSNLIRRDSLFTLYITGYVLEEDKNEIRNIVQRSWQTAMRGQTNISISMITEETYLQQVNSETVTGLVYAVYLNDKLLKATLSEYKVNNNISLEINSSFTALSRTYVVYSVSSLLLNFREQFQLFFTSKMATFQLQEKFKHGLLDSLKLSWEDYHLYRKLLGVHVAYEEKVYINDMHIWRVVYFLTYQNTQILPSFVKPITEKILNDSFNITGLNGVKFRLYTGQMLTSKYFYKSSFNLLFNQEVSKLDWVKIEREINNTWCQKHLKDCTTTSVVIKEQEKYVRQIREILLEIDIFYIFKHKILRFEEIYSD